MDSGPLKINVLFVPYHNTGGHFIDWSIYYLSGQLTRLASKTVEVPVKQEVNSSATNWHQHPSFLLRGFDDLRNTTEILKQKNSNQFVNLYLNTLSPQQVLGYLFNVLYREATDEQKQTAQEYIDQDAEKMLRYCCEQDLPLVIVDYHKNDFLNHTYNDRHRPDLKKVQGKPPKEFYKTQHNNNISKLFDHTLPHLYYTTDDIWNDFDNVVVEILDFLNLTLQQEKFDSWVKIYDQWRKVHKPQFSRHFDRIIDAIVNGHYLKLDRFNFNGIQEEMIRDHLRTQHNLKLPEIELFPNNAQELHKLLESL